MNDVWPFPDRAYGRVDDRRPEEFEGDSVADSVTDLSACSLLAALPDTVVVADAEGRVTYVNPAITTLLGHDPAALMGQPLTTIMPTRFREGHGGHVTRFLTTGEGKLVGQTTQLPALHADGHEVAIDVTLARVGPRPGASPAESSIVSVLRDASTTILLERQLQVSRYLAATLRVTAALTEAPDADVAFERLLPTLCTELDWDAATLWQPENGGSRLVHAGTWTPLEASAPALAAAAADRTFVRGEGLPGLAWQERVPVVIDDLWTDARFLGADAARADALRTGVAFPVLRGERLLGAETGCWWCRSCAPPRSAPFPSNSWTSSPTPASRSASSSAGCARSPTSASSRTRSSGACCPRTCPPSRASASPPGTGPAAVRPSSAETPMT